MKVVYRSIQQTTWRKPEAFSISIGNDIDFITRRIKQQRNKKKTNQQRKKQTKTKKWNEMKKEKKRKTNDIISDIINEIKHIKMTCLWRLLTWQWRVDFFFHSFKPDFISLFFFSFFSWCFFFCFEFFFEKKAILSPTVEVMDVLSMSDNPFWILLMNEPA